MRLLSFHTDRGPAAAVQLRDGLVPVTGLTAPATSVRGLLAALDADGLGELAQRAADSGERMRLSDISLHAPIVDPQKIVCIGLNYRDHAEESGQAIPSSPMWFAKFANSLTGSGQDVVLPGAHPDHVDYEAELALVIGRTAKTSAPSRRSPTSRGRCRSTTSAPATCSSRTRCGRAARRSTRLRHVARPS